MTILMTGGDRIPVDRRVCKCGTHLEWRECYALDCEDGYYHDCGEDCCCCLHPEPNVTCDICEGEGGWLACPLCDADE
jgi:hypothetical protein